ncbi:DUF2089 domain-containing protein [Fusobacteria bacterium ZRK30]|nr:DUF2089 domain-containing protein [Fusobacteria bacterium ZRK30]
MKKINKLIGKCPVCTGELEVIKLTCRNCDTSLEGRFSLHKFLKLSEEELYFIEIFVKNKGNIKEVEKDLKISYPTVRSKLEKVVEVLGYRDKVKKIDKIQILERLEKGEISSEEAMKLLK